MKSSEAERQQYAQTIIPYRAKIDALWKEEARLLETVEADPSVRLSLSETMLNISSYYLLLHDLFVTICKTANEPLLLESRKCIAKALSYLEDVVTKCVDSPFSDYEDKLAVISEVSPEQRYHLVQKLGLSVMLLTKGLGETSRWQWPLVEMEGRAAVVTKNIIDLKNMFVNLDFRSPSYEATFQHTHLVKRLLRNAADRYRARYEISTNQINDFRVAINFLCALRRIHILLGEANDAESLKRTIDGWTAKFDIDIKKTSAGK
jgi:hypothetical protein